MVVTSGSVVCPAAGYAEIALDVSVAVASGDHWFAVSIDNTTATLAVVGTNSHALRCMSAWQDAVFPNPATTATPTNGAGAGGGRWFGLFGIA